MCIEYFDNQEEHNRRANIHSRRNVNKNPGNEEANEDADVKMTNAVKDIAEPESTKYGNKGDVPEDKGMSEDTDDAVVETILAAPAGNMWHSVNKVEEFNLNADGRVPYTNAQDDKFPEEQNKI